MYTWTRRVFRHLPWSTLERYVETNFPVFSLAVLSILVGVPFCCAAIVIIMPAVVVFWNEFFNLYILSVVAVMLIPV